MIWLGTFFSSPFFFNSYLSDKFSNSSANLSNKNLKSKLAIIESNISGEGLPSISETNKVVDLVTNASTVSLSSYSSKPAFS